MYDLWIFMNWLYSWILIKWLIIKLLYTTTASVAFSSTSMTLVVLSVYKHKYIITTVCPCTISVSPNIDEKSILYCHVFWPTYNSIKDAYIY